MGSESWTANMYSRLRWMRGILVWKWGVCLPYAGSRLLVLNLNLESVRSHCLAQIRRVRLHNLYTLMIIEFF